MGAEEGMPDEMKTDPRTMHQGLSGWLEGFKEKEPEFVEKVVEHLETQYEQAEGLTQQVLTSGTEEECREWAEWVHGLVVRAAENELERIGDLDE